MKDSAAKSATSQICQPLWASLRNDTADIQESHQRKTLIVPKKYFAKLKNKS